MQKRTFHWKVREDNMKDISSLDIIPEQFEVEQLYHIPSDIMRYSEMHPVERQFINGLIRILKPHRILELGIAEGAGSVVILNAIKDMPDSILASFDVSKKLWNDPSKRTGFIVERMYPNGNSQWRIHLGADFSEYAETFDRPFDMVIIDTVHLHPIESLNFISILPYLSDGAVVMFHDLALYTCQDKDFNRFPNISFANKLAYDTIVGKKLKPRDNQYIKDNHGIASLGAVQISADTKKYIRNLFDMLFFPWNSYFHYVSPFVRSLNKLVKKNYSQELFDIFCHAVMGGAIFSSSEYRYANIENNILDIYQRIKTQASLVFYGAGNNCLQLLNFFQRNDLPEPNEIWDISPSGGMMNGIPLKKPRFADMKTEYSDTLFIITINDRKISKLIREQMLSENPNAKVYIFQEIIKSLTYAELEKVFEIR